MRTHTFLLVAVAGLLLLAWSVAAEEAPPQAPPTVSDADATAALEKFKREFDTKDLDFQLEAVITLGKVHHPKVAEQLFRLLKLQEIEIQVEAMKALGRQVCFARKLERRIGSFLDEKQFQPRVVASTIQTIGLLDLRRYEEDLVDMINSNDDEVAISALRVLARWRSYKSLKDILLVWEFYPEDGKWQTGSVTVDTGAAGDVDQRAAKAKWQAKYGGRAKRARPELVQAIRATANAIIGIEEEEKLLKRPVELREWLSENKVMMRRYR